MYHLLINFDHKFFSASNCRSTTVCTVASIATQIAQYKECVLLMFNQIVRIICKCSLVFPFCPLYPLKGQYKIFTSGCFIFKDWISFYVEN